MKPILRKEKRHKITIEETISNSLYPLVELFNVTHDYCTYKEIKHKAKVKLSEKHYEVFCDLYILKIKKNVKAIRIVRKLKNEKDYDKRFEILAKYIKSIQKIIHALNYLDSLMIGAESDIVKDDSAGNYQSWCIEYVYILLQD